MTKLESSNNRIYSAIIMIGLRLVFNSNKITPCSVRYHSLIHKWNTRINLGVKLNQNFNSGRLSF